MEKRPLLWRNLFEMSLSARLVHTLVLLGVPVSCWELFDLWRQARDNPFFGTQAVAFGIALALLAGLTTGVAAALIEQALISLLRRHRRQPHRQ